MLYCPQIAWWRRRSPTKQGIYPSTPLREPSRAAARHPAILGRRYRKEGADLVTGCESAIVDASSSAYSVAGFWCPLILVPLAQDKASVGSACQGQAPAAARLKARGRMSDKAAPMSTASRAVLGEARPAGSCPAHACMHCCPHIE